MQCKADSSQQPLVSSDAFITDVKPAPCRHAENVAPTVISITKLGPDNHRIFETLRNYCVMPTDHHHRKLIPSCRRAVTNSSRRCLADRHPGIPSETLVTNTYIIQQPQISLNLLNVRLALKDEFIISDAVSHEYLLSTGTAPDTWADGCDGGRSAKQRRGHDTVQRRRRRPNAAQDNATSLMLLLQRKSRV